MSLAALHVPKLFSAKRDSAAGTPQAHSSYSSQDEEN